MRLHVVSKQIEALTSQKTTLEAEEALLQKKNAMMRPGSVDKDLLEERVRTVLGYRAPDDYTVMGH